MRITVQLIRASDSSQVWSETYDRTLDDIFKVQDEIAATVVKKLRLTLLGATPTARAVDPRAYPLILQAEALTTETSAASTSKAIMLYQQALEIAPDEPRAWSGLGRAYANQVVTGIGPAEQGIALAEQALKKAIAADPNDAVAYSRLGGFYSSVKNAPAAAAPFYEKAMALNPRDETVIGNAGVFLINLGRLEEAGVLFDWKALRDPASATAINNVAVLDYYAGHWERSIAANRTVLALSPGYALAHGSIGTMMLLAHGNAADALSEMQAEPDEIFKLGGTAMALHTLGRDAESDAAMDALIAQHATDGALTIATAFAWRGEADRAFKWLHNAIAAGDPSLVTVHLEPIIAGLHDDPRWMPLLRKLGQTREQLSKIAFKVTLPEDGVKESGNANTTR